jgi:DHA1 family tetracycline resistance protein-like MFS transporter
VQTKYIPAYLLTFVNVLGFTLIMPVLPFVVERYGGSKLMYGFLLSAYAFFQFLGAPWLGRLSDSVGRKPVLLISQAGTLLSWFVFGAAWFLPNLSLGLIALPLLVIALSRVLDGVTGGNTSVTQAYVSDISTHQEKSVIFGTIGGIVGIGMVAGPGLGGYIASGSLGYLGVAICGAVISAITLLTIQVWLKESLPVEIRKPPQKQSFIESFRLLKRIQNLDPGRAIKQLFLVRGFFSAMMAAYVSTIPLYMIDLFKFDARQLGLFMMVVGLFIAFNNAVVSKWFVRRFGEIQTMRMGLILCAVGLFTITLTDVLWRYFACYFVLNLGVSLSIPTVNALIAQRARTRDMGEVMGIGYSLVSLSNACLPIMAATLYGIMGGELYHLVAILPLLGFLVASRIQEVPHQPTTEHLETDTADVHDKDGPP